MNFKNQLTFAYLACERLLPNYIYFSFHFKFGNTEVLQDTINFIYQTIIDSPFQESTIIDLLKNINKNTPYPDKFNTILASSALDTCSVISETLNFILDKKFKRIENISTLATDTIDMYIQVRDDLDFNTDEKFDEKIQNDPLMKQEIKIQQEISLFLAKINVVNDADIDTLIELQRSNSSLNLKL